MPDRDLSFTPATDLHRFYQARKTSPLEVMGAVVLIGLVLYLLSTYV